jgi:hypothetical protein
MIHVAKSPEATNIQRMSINVSIIFFNFEVSKKSPIDNKARNNQEDKSLKAATE